VRGKRPNAVRRGLVLAAIVALVGAACSSDGTESAPPDTRVPAASAPVPSDIPGAKGPAGARAVAPLDGPGEPLSAVWATDGGDKVTREELRATDDGDAVENALWDGETIVVSGARNEVVGFAVIVEAGNGDAGQVDLRLDRLEGRDTAEFCATFSPTPALVGRGENSESPGRG